MPIEYKTFGAEVKAFDDTNLTVDHFISTEHKDRGGDIMRAKGMKIVGKPVVLLLHGRGSMGSEPVGKPLSINVDEYKGQPGILAKTQFFPDEVGTRLYQKVKGGFLPNWSIGYMVDEAKDLMREGKYYGRDVTKWTLLEYSPVGVPMNPFAHTIKEFLDKVEKGEEIKAEESRWFGFVDTKEGDDHNWTCEKHGLRPLKGSSCPVCESEEKPYPNEHACRIKEPMQFDRIRRENNKFGDGIHAIWGVKNDKATLQAIRWDSSKFTADAAKKWAKDHDYTCILFEPATGKDEEIQEAEPELIKQIVIDEKLLVISEAIIKLDTAVASLIEKFKKLEPLLSPPPPEPDGGDKGDEGDTNNHPEKVDPPRLVFRDSAKEAEDEERRKAEERERTVAAIAEAIRPVFKAQVDKLMGRVP